MLADELPRLMPGYPVPGNPVIWRGQYQAMQRVKDRLKTGIVVLAVPFSAIWFLYLLGYNMSIGVWVGLIALLGVDAETEVFMLLHLDLAYADASQ